MRQLRIQISVCHGHEGWICSRAGGCPLLGGEGSKDHPVYNINVSCYYGYCYVSRKLFPREQRCSIIEKECLTVKWAAETLWHYLPGSEFTLVTDHYSLLQTNRMKGRNTRITQQRLYFTGF